MKDRRTICPLYAPAWMNLQKIGVPTDFVRWPQCRMIDAASVQKSKRTFFKLLSTGFNELFNELLAISVRLELNAMRWNCASFKSNS